MTAKHGSLSSPSLTILSFRVSIENTRNTGDGNLDNPDNLDKELARTTTLMHKLISTVLRTSMVRNTFLFLTDSI